MKRLLKVLAWLLGIVILLVGLTVLAFTISVRPGVYIIQKLFDQPIEIMYEEKYDVDAPKVEILKDIEYRSSYDNNILDIIYPKDGDGPYPIMFWVHGGGYVGGDKAGVTEFATYIAAENDMAVVTLNYEKAPSLQYPGQVYQLEDVYQFLYEEKDEYSMLDFEKVMFGGDSAGAQIAGQYVVIQTNDSYADQMNVEQIIDKDHLKGYISYSGPVDIQQMKDVKSSSFFLKFFTSTVARAFIGERNWQESEAIIEASIKEYVTEDFPATYITDGNSFSFPTQGLALEEALKEKDVYVKSLFFQDSDKEITHEYQFNYEMEEAKKALDETINFIYEQLKE